jgi:hypothetical protein
MFIDYESREAAAPTQMSRSISGSVPRAQDLQDRGEYMKRTRQKEKENAVARAVSELGGPTKAARICRVSNAAIHKWIQRGSVSLLRHALRLSRASGVPVEQFVGDEDEE